MTSISNAARAAMSHELCQIRPFRQHTHGERAWILGSRYEHLSISPTQRARLRAHLHAIVWFTYRCGFAPLLNHENRPRGESGPAFTSDAGWGCMVRTGQMMLAETLRRHWAFHDSGGGNGGGGGGGSGGGGSGGDDEFTLLRLLRLFADAPAAPFSLHAMVRRGAARYDTRVGAWYGPTVVSKVLRDLVEEHGRVAVAAGGARASMAALVAKDGVVYVSEVEARCCPSPRLAGCEDGEDGAADPLHAPPPPSEPAAWSCSLLLLIPLRLGLEKVDADYIQPLRATFQFPQSVGLMGGKRAHALYIVGAHGRDAFVLDPHTVQPAATLAAPASVPAALASLRTDKPLVMALGDVDPSLALGFFCRDRRDFEDLRQNIEQLGVHAPFMVAAAPPDMSESMLACVASGMDNCDDDADDEDEYVLISGGRW